MDDLGKWIIHDAPAVPAKGSTVGDLLVVQKVTGVEETDAVDHVAPDKIVATWDPVAFAYRIMVPRHVVDEAGPRKESFQAGRRKKDIPWRGKKTARGL